MMNAVDYDGDGCITFDEFVPLMRTIIYEDLYLEEEIIEVFAIYDRERQGLIAMPDLSKVLARLDISDGNVTCILIYDTYLGNKYFTNVKLMFL